MVYTLCLPQVFPESFAHCNHDFSALLAGANVSMSQPDEEMVANVVTILSHSPHKYKWFRKVRMLMNLCDDAAVLSF